MRGLFRAISEYLLEPTSPAGPVTPAKVRLERLLFGGTYLLAMVVCALFLPGGHGFSLVTPVALVLLSVSMRFNLQRTASSWTSCEQAAFVMVAFAIPLNLLPLAMFACGAVVQPRRPKPLLTLLVTACNSWSGVAAAVLLSLLAPGTADWSHWFAYTIAFGAQIVISALVFAARGWVKGQPMPLEDAVSALAVDASLTPVGLAAAVELRAAPAAAVALMLGATALLALTDHEHGQRIVQTERALRDSLTGLANRALFSEASSACERRCLRTNTDAGLLLIDLDDFKTINDSFGHQAGDQVLESFARGLQEATRAVDLPARLGGDEFAVILSEPIDLAGVAQVAETIRTRLADATDLATDQKGPVGLSVGFSLGYALFGSSSPLSEAISAADAALYADKRSRKHPPVRS